MLGMNNDAAAVKAAIVVLMVLERLNFMDVYWTLARG